MPGLRAEFSLDIEGELSMLIVMDEKDVMYPLAPYPVIREFSAMLDGIHPGQTWSGGYFLSYATGSEPGEPVRFYFRRKRDGITLGFSAEEWQRLKELFAAVAAIPKLQMFYQELSLAYGEL